MINDVEHFLRWQWFIWLASFISTCSSPLPIWVFGAGGAIISPNFSLLPLTSFLQVLQLYINRQFKSIFSQLIDVLSIFLHFVLLLYGWFLSLCQVYFYFSISNLPLLPYYVLFIIHIAVFISRSWIWLLFISSMSFEFLNIWNTVIITVLKSLFANSNICVSYGSLSINWFFVCLFMGCILLLLWKHDNFWLDPRYKFYLIEYWIFLYWYQFSLALSRIHFSYLESIWSFWVCIQGLFGKTIAALSLELLIPLYWGMTLLCTPPNGHGLQCFSVCWEHFSWYFCAYFVIFPLILLNSVFPCLR